MRDRIQPRALPYNPFCEGKVPEQATLTVSNARLPNTCPAHAEGCSNSQSMTHLASDGNNFTVLWVSYYTIIV